MKTEPTPDSLVKFALEWFREVNGGVWEGQTTDI